MNGDGYRVLTNRFWAMLTYIARWSVFTVQHT